MEKKEYSIKLSYKKSINENVNDIYELIKKLKKKIKGAEEAIMQLEQKIANREKELKKKKIKIIRDKKFWFEKYRWFITSRGHLCVAGRDATSNEVIIKKYMNENDLVFHTVMPGSPFGILKSKDDALLKLSKEYGFKIEDEFNESEFQECADFIASYSKAWKQNLSALECFYVKPEQVSKKAPSGEYIAKGSFMIYGKKNIVIGRLGLLLLPVSDLIFVLPYNSLLHYKDFIESVDFDRCGLILPSNKGLKVGEVIKKISKALNFDENYVQNLLPSGNFDLKILTKDMIKAEFNKTNRIRSN